MAITFSTAYTAEAQTRAYRVSDRQVQVLINRIETGTDTFRRQVDRNLDRSAINGTRTEDNLASFVTDFENATDSLRRRFESRTSTTADVQEVLNRASVIENFVRDSRLSAAAQRQWNLVRTDLDTLATYYGVRWDWTATYNTYRNNDRNNDRYNNNNRGGYGQNGIGRGGRFDARLTGTYRLNVSQSDDVNAVLDRSFGTGNINADQRTRMRERLERRLTPPDMLAIEKMNTRVTIASSLSPQISIDADNVSRSEVSGNGRTVNIRAAQDRDTLSISYEGDRMNDFHITFVPVGNNQLRVTRRLYLENRGETVVVSSVYDKIDPVARWTDMGGSYNTGNTGGYNNNNNNTNYNNYDFAVPNGTRLVAVLNTPLSTRTTQNGDRFTMEVTAPAQYRGAIIEGTVMNAERSGRVSGRAEMGLNFETIRLRNGQTYRFTGLIDGVRNANGDTVSINNEGAVRDNNQTTKTVTRAGIGAALGALIGAIAGGGQGAAIGAGVGAGAGAGSVILQGRDDLRLDTGTEFSLTSSAPANLRGSY
ncbi:MAG: hypothetical protein M3384_04900 [Acidobacteriota bacterium]|nr:hypothetical protein [Acidobacteriota bacterium]